MRRTIAVSAALASLLLILPILTHAAPVVTQDLAYVDNRSLSDIFGHTGLNLNIDVKATDALGSDALKFGSVTATASNGSFPFSEPVNVPLNAVYPLANGAHFTRNNLSITAGQFPDITGTYTFEVTNSSLEKVFSTSHTLDKLEVIPLPTNLDFSDQSTTPLFTFIDPDPTPNVAGLNRKYQVEIFDFGTKMNIFSSIILTSPSFSVPAGLLAFGTDYYFRAVSWDFDPADFGGAPLHSNGENRAIEYATFHTVPEPSTMLLLGSGLAGLVGYGRRRFKK